MSVTETVKVEKPHPLKLVVQMIWLGMAILVGTHLVVTTFTKHFMIVYDGAEVGMRCIPDYSVYLLKRNYGTVQLGKIYTFKAQNMSPFYPDNTLISKYFVGKSGDTVVQNEHGVFVNGAKIASGYPSRDKLEVPKESFYTTYSIADNNYFVTAPAERSYDSRYWGTVDESQIIGEAIPLW